MGPLSRQSVVGFAIGVVFTLGASLLGGYLLLKTRPGDPAEGMGALLPSPRFPSAEQLVVHGSADYDWPLRELDGRLTSLSEFRNKVVFVHFWATWCRPWCVAELPGIQRLYDTLSQEGVEFVLISEDQDEDALRKFLIERHVTVPVYLQDKDVPPVFGAVGVPATFVIGRDGSVLYRHVGPAQWDDESARVFLRALKHMRAKGDP